MQPNETVEALVSMECDKIRSKCIMAPYYQREVGQWAD